MTEASRAWKALAKRYKRAHANALHSLVRLVQQHRDLDEHVSRLLDIQGAMALQIERAEEKTPSICIETDASIPPGEVHLVAADGTRFVAYTSGPKGKVQ